MCLGTGALAEGQESGWRYGIGEGIRITLLPATDLYPSYMAALREPRFALKIMSMTRRGIEQTPRSRLGTWVGGSVGLFRVHPAGQSGRGFQLQLGAGGFAQWEEQGRDGIGWDGVYRVLGTWTTGEELAFRVGISHMSSHIVDEYIENTGRRRIGYTREEMVAGARCGLNGSWQPYLEVGYAHLMRSALQEPWRFQTGLEYTSGPAWWNGRAGFFAALDAQSHQENQWKVSTALQMGLRIPVRELGRTYRVGLEVYRGRAPMGEFFQADESHVALGWWLDF